MAREERTPKHFDALAQRLSATAEMLEAVASTMRDGNMGSALVHATLAENTHIPAIEDWIDKVTIDVRAQLRALTAGVQSNAERRKKEHESQKTAAAKRSVNTRAAKKQPS